MEEKKSNGISVSAFFLIIAIIVIVAMGYFIYKFYNDKTNETKRADDLQGQVDRLNGKIQELNIENNNIKEEKEDLLKSTNSNENISDETVFEDIPEDLDGMFFNGENGKNSEIYTFSKSDKQVNYQNEMTFYYGTYSISENKVIIDLTRKIEYGTSNYENINETRVLEFVSNNILQDEDNTRYINKNTKTGAFVSENSRSVGGNSTDEIWYTFYYNGGVRYSDSENELFGTYEIKENVITITFYFCNETHGLGNYQGTKILRLTDDGIFDEEINMNYIGYADGW